MNDDSFQDELDRRNDETLAHLEDEWLEPDEDEEEQDDDGWGASIAEDEFMDERDGLND